VTTRLTEQSINEFVAAWYKALDQHDEFSSVKEMVVDDGLEMRFPEVTARGHAGFGEWYETVINRFFDEVHTITKVEPVIEGEEATVSVLVNWQAKVWNPPAPNSEWLGFDADQTWVLVAGESGPKIRTYIVNGLDPMPGSASL
jgi:hypothetical protein